MSASDHLSGEPYAHEFGVNGRDVESGYREEVLGHDPEYSHPGNHPLIQRQLDASVEDHGIKTPLEIGSHFDGTNPGTFSITDGSHRLLAAKRAGQKHIPVVVRR